jgi:hypothetical protein
MERVAMIGRTFYLRKRNLMERLEVKYDDLEIKMSAFKAVDAQ